MALIIAPMIPANILDVRKRIEAATLASGRAAGSVSLLAVSKTWPAAALRAAFVAGQRTFGENYVQEAAWKIAALTDIRASIEWHFIGPLQANKTKTVAELFDWVHGIDRLKIAERLSAQRGSALVPLQVCLQVNVSGEASKSGVRPEDVLPLARTVADLKHLRLRGLMCIPEPTDDRVLLRSRFACLRQIFEALRAEGFDLDTLSMGMSHDFDAAILEGATLVRVGTAIFGSRGQITTKPDRS